MITEYKNGIWAEKIISLQKMDGSWGCFHTLSRPTREQPITTEQALRRLKILGFTKEDESIARAIQYMESCIKNPEPIVFIEKKHDSKIYGDLMLATWLRTFDKDNEAAIDVTKKWTKIVSCAFKNGKYEYENYVAAYESIFAKKLNPKAGCLTNFVVFYQVSLLNDCFDEKIETAVFEYIMNYPKGISYIYNEPLFKLPEIFASKQTGRYLSAIELLARYRKNRSKLQFVVDWLNENKDKNGQWDLGKSAKDNIYFPLSNSWRKDEYRKADCTERINSLIKSILL